MVVIMVETKAVMTVTMAVTTLLKVNVPMESIQLKENVTDFINVHMVTDIQTNIVQRVFFSTDKFVTGQKMLTVVTHLQNQRSQLNQKSQASISINVLLIVKKKLPCGNGGHAMPVVVLSQTIKKQLLQQPPLLLLPLQLPKLKKIITNMDSGNATGVVRKMVVDVGVAGSNARTHQSQHQNVKMENKRLMMTAQSTTHAKTVLLSSNLVPGVSDTMPKIRNVHLCSS